MKAKKDLEKDAKREYSKFWGMLSWLMGKNLSWQRWGWELFHIFSLYFHQAAGRFAEGLENHIPAPLMIKTCDIDSKQKTCYIDCNSFPSVPYPLTILKIQGKTQGNRFQKSGERSVYG